MKTLVLLSGGLDSAVILANLVRHYDECAAIGFNYGQRYAAVELERADMIAAYYLVPFEVIRLPDIPKTDDVVFAGRNLLFIAAAVPCAHALGCGRIAIGCNATDWDRFPDCRPAFWQGVKHAVAGAYGITIATPLLHYSKIDVVKMARELEVDIELTWSCYQPVFEHGVYTPCGKCLACSVRTGAIEWEASSRQST